jgi:hypothetical protein
MTRKTTLDLELRRAAFAKEAAARFAADSRLATYAESLQPGGWLALRWGLTEDCVMVVCLSEDEDPVNFQGIIPRK